jgi:hypothetical protein
MQSFPMKPVLLCVLLDQCQCLPPPQLEETMQQQLLEDLPLVVGFEVVEGQALVQV